MPAVITFDLLLSVLMLTRQIVSNAQNCNYSGKLKPGEKYYAYNPSYSNPDKNETHCKWETKGCTVNISCNLEIPGSPNCKKGSLSITFDDGETKKYCGFKNFDMEGANPTIIFDTQYSDQGNKFLCIMEAKKFDEYNCQCGMKNPTRIVGGNETGVNEYPMMIGLVDAKKEKTVYCGGTLIAERFILTAAHCIIKRNVSALLVVVGDHDLSTGNDTNAAKVYRISYCKQHPNYKVESSSYDIAICKTANVIQYSVKVGPACLPFQHKCDSFSGEIVQMLGWGLLHFGGEKADKLQVVDVSVTSSYICFKTYPNEEASNILCTYTPGKDACQMDSGGPVLWQNPTTRRIVLIGIISAGLGCASDQPALNTRVGSLLDWIESETPCAQYCKLD